MADPLNPQPQRNYLDDILDQAFNDLELERQRQESIINANDPDKVLSQLNKVDKQIENEPEEVQQAVRQKVYKPGYFDRDRQMMDWKPQGKSVVESKDNTKSIDETIQRYKQYEQLFPQYFQQEYDKVVQDLGQVKTSEDRDVIRGPFSKEPTYTEQDLEAKAITQAKKRLSDEGILEPKRTFLGTLKETFTDYKKFGSKLPYLGGGVESYEALDLLQSIKDIQRGTADQADYATVMNAQLEMERDSDFGAMVADIMIQLPAYAVEFSTTAGTYTAGRKAGQKALQESVNWVLSKQGKKIIKEGADRFGLKAVKGVVGATTGTLARTVDPRMFSRVVANVSRELLPDYELNRKLDGKLEVLSSNEKSLGKSIVDGYLLTYLELLGEQSGEALPFLGKEFKTFIKSKPESAVHGLLKSLIRKNPDVPPGKFMQGVRQAGIQSVPVELMEERFTDFLQSGVEGHEFEWPTAEEWLAEIVAIGGFSASVRGVGKGLDKRAEKKLEKAKTKGLEAIESGQLRQLTDQDISDFIRSLTKEEAMEIGIAQETAEVDTGSELGKEMIRRELDMEKFPETLRELREEEARKTIKEQKIEGEDFVGKLIEKAQLESGIAIEREYLDRTLADEIADEELSEERAKEILREHGIDEDFNPEKVMITGRTSGFVVRLSTAGTQERMAEEFVAVSEEMAEVYYNAEVENIGEQEFENEIAKDRKNYHEATGEQDTGESNKEWFSTMALRFATQGKVHKSIGAKLKQIFQDLMERAQILLQDAFRLRKAIREGKVSDSLLKKLEEATDFKKVGEKVKQAKKSKKDPTYRTVRKPKGKDVLGRDIPDWRGATVFHSTNEKSVEDIKQKGYRTDIEDQSGYYGKAISFTPDIEYTKQFGDIVTTAKISKDAKILNQNDPEDSKVFDSIMKGKGWGPDMHQYFLDAGIDGVYDPGAGDLFIYNPKVVTYESSKPSTSYRLSKKSGGDLVWKNTPIVKQPNLLELTKYLTERAKSIADELGVDLTQNTPEAIDIISNVIAEEIKIETGNKKNALGWYSIKMQNAIELLSQIHPEIMQDPDHNQVFKVALAITSNGTPVEDNLKIAMVAYEHWKDNGVLPSTFKVGGQEGPAMASAFKVYNKHQKEIGTTAFHTFLNTEFTVKEITDMGYKVNGELVDAKVMGAVIFGPKVGGGFLSNLNGHYQYLTMDRWFMRTMGRIRGNLKPQQDYSKQLKRFRTALRINPSKMKLYDVSKEDLKNDDKVIEVARKVLKEYAKPKYVKKENRKKSFYPKTELNKASNTLVKNIDKIYEAPANGTDRKYLREIMAMAVEKSDVEGLTMADAQAIIWFPEKRFFSKFGVGSQRGKKETDYETEARKYVESRLGSVQPIRSSARRSATGIKESTQKPESLGKEKPTYRLAPTWYSKAERVVTEQFPPTMKSQSVENFLKKNQVKPEEIQWLDLETLLKGKQKVTKEELQEWIQANKIEVEDVMKIDEDDKIIFRVGDLEVYRDNELVDYTREFNPSDPVENLKMVLVEDLEINKWDIMKNPKRELLDYLDQKYQDQNNQLEYSEKLGENTDNYLERIAYISDLQSKVKQDDFEFDLKEAKTPKYPEHQLPGEKEDYRELLLTLPTAESAEPLSGYVVFKKEDDVEDFLTNAVMEGMEDLDYGRTDEDNHRRVEFENIPDSRATLFLNLIQDYELDWWKTNQDTRKKLGKDTFKSGHYDEPNILAHVRFNTRKSPTGEKVLFIEELQSDWHTKGREKGYKGKITKLPEGYTIRKWKKSNDAIVLGDSSPDGNRYQVINPSGGVAGAVFINEKDAIADAISNINKGSVPDAPFKNNGWIELIMKRMLRYASENNFDRIAWTTANQQIDRWKNELRQNVDQISWQKLVAEKRELTLEETLAGAFRHEPVDRTLEKFEELKTQDVGKQSVIVNGLKKNKSVFNQTIPIEGETTINGQKVTLEGLLGKQMATQIRNSEDRTGVIEGDDLTVGGQGFKVVYDFAIKKILNKMGKKFNAKVDQVNIDSGFEPVVLNKKYIKKSDSYKVDYQFYDQDNNDYMVKNVLIPADQIKTKVPLSINTAIENYLYSMQGMAQPSIPVTRKMKESALKGQPTFRASKMTSSDDVLSSPSFKKWFKGSQIKDKDGKPLVVYHGTVNDFDEFREGSYFSPSSDVANFYARDHRSGFFGSEQGGQIYPVYLSIKKPFDLTSIPDHTVDLGSNANIDDFLLYINVTLPDEGLNSFEREYIENGVIKDNPEFYYDFIDNNKNLFNILKNKGFDGIIGQEIILEGRSGKVYIPFEPTQIKSIFNKGTFNPHDPRISFRMAPTNLVTPLAKIYHEQKGNKKSYTKKDFELDLVRLGYPEETLKTAMDLFGIIRIKQIETDEPTPIEKELKKIQDLAVTRSNLKDRIKRAYRLGAVEKEKEINKLQKIVTKYARKNLPTGLFKKSEVTGLLAKVRDAKRARELATALERIDRIVDKVNKRSALAKWNKTVKKKATVKKVGGIGRGKVGADVQDIVNDIRGKKKGEGIMDLSPADVELKIELMGKVMGESEDGEPTDDQALQLNLLLTYGAMKHKTPEEITRATEQFDELVTAGRMQVVEDQEAYKERMKEIGEEILEVITGGAGAQTQAGAQALGLNKKGLLADIKETLSTIDSQNQSLEYIFDKLSRLDKTSKPLESAINNYFMPMIRQARLAEYSGLVEMNTMLRENAERIFKVKDGKLTKRLNENTVNTINIRHRDGVDGLIMYSELTYNQAYKKWMELKDPTLENTFEKMGWDINKTKRQIEDQLPKDMIKWAEWQLYEFYPMYYHRVNEVFRKRFNVNMPFNPMYSPISRRIGARADEGDDTLNKSKSPMGSMTSAGSLKARVSNVEELDWIDGDTTMMKHITEMEHFIHYTQVMREMRSVFMNRNISRSISDFHGNGISRTLNKFMDDIARGGVDRAQNLKELDKLRANFSRSVIGVNPVVYLKQLASIPAYIADIPALDWSTEFAKVFTKLEFKRMYRTLSKSKMVEMRYDQGFERDMVLALQNQKPGKLISGTDWVNTFAYAFTKMGDKQAIFLGGWAVYKYHKKKALKEGKSLKDAEAIAMRKFEEASLRSQQASNVEDLADFQRRGSLAKLFTMFMTSPNQYYRMVIGGYRNLRAGRGSKSENLRRIFVGQFLLPTLFQFISNGFKWDDEDQAISILLFPFAGLLFFGQGFEYMIRSAFNKAYPMGPVSILDPFIDLGKGFGKTFDGKEFDNKKVFKILDEYASGLSKIFGVPYSGPKRSIENTIKVLTEDSDLSLKDKTLKGIGFRMEEEKKKKKNKKKPKIGGPVYAY